MLTSMAWASLSIIATRYSRTSICDDKKLCPTFFMYLTQPSRRDTAHIHHTMKYFGIIPVLISLMTSCATVFADRKQSDLRQRHRRKSDPTIDGRKYTNVTFPTRPKSDAVSTKRSSKPNRLPIQRKRLSSTKFQRSIGHQSAGHTRMGNRRRDRSHDQTGIQILSD